MAERREIVMLGRKDGPYFGILAVACDANHEKELRQAGYETISGPGKAIHAVRFFQDGEFWWEIRGLDA